ncbi:hypothetical protein ASZ90_016821 [hydrocarbon metagenome]|uniref:Uncharacterized protein n=1 Tax=hydrocarbon metagenome TaxID=938273 RepID=A0A0W8EAR4_9ZZZZ
MTGSGSSRCIVPGCVQPSGAGKGQMNSQCSPCSIDRNPVRPFISFAKIHHDY